MFNKIKNMFVQKKGLSPPDRGWVTLFDSFTGAWQQGSDYNAGSVLSFSPVFRCLNLISSDIAKIPVQLMENQGGYWKELMGDRRAMVLQRPNHYQTRYSFFESWVLSKLQYGNAYILKGRDGSGLVNALYPIDPSLVKVLISDGGDVFYKIKENRLNGIQTEVTVPAREMIHDMHITLDHKLVGISQIAAAGLGAQQGLNIQNSSTKLFGNMAMPSGILTAPGKIDQVTADNLRTRWATNYGGDNFGAVAVLGNDLSFQAITTNAVDAQLIEQLQWTAKDVCMAFGVPPYKLGIGDMPAYSNINALDQAYYSQTLQALIRSIEERLTDGLGLDLLKFKVNLDERELLRMDAKTKAEIMAIRLGAGMLSPNEARQDENLPPVDGGESPMIQQQNYSLAALKKRDDKEDPFSTGQPTDTANQNDLDNAFEATGT